MDIPRITNKSTAKCKNIIFLKFILFFFIFSIIVIYPLNIIDLTIENNVFPVVNVLYFHL